MHAGMRLTCCISSHCSSASDRHVSHHIGDRVNHSNLHWLLDIYCIYGQCRRVEWDGWIQAQTLVVLIIMQQLLSYMVITLSLKICRRMSHQTCTSSSTRMQHIKQFISCASDTHNDRHDHDVSHQGQGKSLLE